MARASWRFVLPMTAWGCLPDGRSKHRRAWGCRSRANASWVSILTEIAASLSGHAKEAEQRWRFRCRCDLQESEPVAQPAEQIRVLVVDDEAPARQRLMDLLRKDPRIGSVLEAVNGKV